MTPRMTESELRKLIVNRIQAEYPDSDARYTLFLGGAKATIDGWLGDAFAIVIQENGLQNRYEYWRQRLFND